MSLSSLALLLSGCAALSSDGGTGGASCRDIATGHAAHFAHVVSRVGSPTAGIPGSLVTAADLDPEPSPAPPMPTRRWSDPAGWPDGRMPAAGDVVEIPAHDVVLLDASPPALAGLLLEGALVFDEQDLALSSDWILVRGEHAGLYVGSAEAPFLHRAAINLTGAKAAESGCYGNKFIGLMDAKLELYGDPTGVSWTRLATTAVAGTTTITVDDAAGWRPGDEIVIASTDYYGYAGEDGEGYDRQVEERSVSAVNGNTIVLDEPLEYMHFGQVQTFGTGIGFPTTLLESRAEVMRLSRNVVVRAEEATLVEGSDRYRFGGHIMAMGDSRVRLDSVEVTRMGQAGALLRYPVHFHLMGDAGHGSYIRNSSLHHLFNRCVTIHGTNDVLVRDSAAYDTFGHCYFLEDGAERGNVLQGNLGLMARKPSEATALLPSDNVFLGPALFWVTNPDNVLVGNVAASSAGTGFWYALPEHPTGPSFDIFGGENWWLRRTPLGVFDSNMAHSNAADGLHVDRGPTADTSGIETTSYRPRSDPADLDSEPVIAVFENFTAYRHRNSGAWFRGDHTVLRGALLADNAVGVTFASNLSGLENSVLVGETANLGTVMSWETAGQDGRSLPRPWDDGPSFAIRGFEFYDGEVWAKDVYFENYEPNAQREAAAISVLDYTSFSLSPLNYGRGLIFAPGTNEVYLETRVIDDTQHAATDSNEDGYRSAVFRDLDGTVTGAAGSYVAVDNDLLLDDSCSYRSAWNAHVCGGRYASLTLNNRDEDAAELAPVNVRRGGVPGSEPRHVMYGSPRGGADTPNTHFRTLAPMGHEYHYDFAGATPDEFTVEIQDIEPGDTMLVSLPLTGFEPYIYRDWWIDSRNLIDGYASLSALRTAGDSGYSGYFSDGSRLYLLLAQQDERDYAHLTVCRAYLCD